MHPTKRLLPFLCFSLALAGTLSTDPADARPMLGDPELRYLASPGFAALLLAHSESAAASTASAAKGAATCAPRLRMLSVEPLEAMSMEGDVHPHHGLLVVRFEREACGQLSERHVLVTARLGETPRVVDWAPPTR